jgi:hypothetical protein
VGFTLGLVLDGPRDGETLGLTLGTALVGDRVGVALGFTLGLAVGIGVDGDREGAGVGDCEGEAVGGGGMHPHSSARRCAHDRCRAVPFSSLVHVTSHGEDSAHSVHVCVPFPIQYSVSSTVRLLYPYRNWAHVS